MGITFDYMHSCLLNISSTKCLIAIISANGAFEVAYMLILYLFDLCLNCHFQVVKADVFTIEGHGPLSHMFQSHFIRGLDPFSKWKVRTCAKPICYCT